MKANDISLYDLVGKRFNTLDQLKMAIEKISNMKVDMIAESQTERPEDSDDMIDFSDDSETIAEEAEYLIGVFDKLKKSEDFNILAHHLDTMFMDGVFK